MIQTKPWPGHPEEELAPPDAVTVEFSDIELLEALCMYAGTKRRESFLAHGFVQVRTELEPKKKAVVRLTYWKAPP